MAYDQWSIDRYDRDAACQKWRKRKEIDTQALCICAVGMRVRFPGGVWLHSVGNMHMGYTPRDVMALRKLG